MDKAPRNCILTKPPYTMEDYTMVEGGALRLVVTPRHLRIREWSDEELAEKREDRHDSQSVQLPAWRVVAQVTGGSALVASVFVLLLLQGCGHLSSVNSEAGVKRQVTVEVLGALRTCEEIRVGLAETIDADWPSWAIGAVQLQEEEGCMASVDICHQASVRVLAQGDGVDFCTYLPLVSSYCGTKVVGDLTRAYTSAPQVTEFPGCLPTYQVQLRLGDEAIFVEMVRNWMRKGSRSYKFGVVAMYDAVAYLPRMRESLAPSMVELRDNLDGDAELSVEAGLVLQRTHQVSLADDGQ
jgi:hypothetical protein